MTSEQVRKRIVEAGIIPVVRAASPREAMLAVEAVTLGGIPIVEMTMTVPGALDVISEISRTMHPDILVGAGTVLDAETAQRCIDAGAQFIVSPGLDLGTVKFCKSVDRLVMAGALTPTEVITAWKAGSQMDKIFPCGNVGGAKYIKALKGPLPQVPMVPTGGVNLETAADFIRAGAEALGIGGELVLASALKSGKIEAITELARQYVAVIKEARKPSELLSAVQ